MIPSIPLSRLAWGSLLCAGIAAASEPFFAPPQASGSLEVKLYPTEKVAAGTPALVTFGLPFPRGSVGPADLAKVRVLEDGKEIPAHVEMLTPWRHFTDVSLNGASVRVARVQFRHTFAKAYPGFETATVEWGKAARTRDVAALSPPRGAWHPVTEGTFVAADNVYEPDVYAVLPKAWMCQGLLRPMRMEPFTDAVPETRDDPAKVGFPIAWSAAEDQMYGAKDFFFTTINEDDTRDTAVSRYKTDFEPWLFDRSSSMFSLYFRSGFFKPLREAVRSAAFYANHLTAAGFFDLKAEEDAKYSYNECLAYAYWTTADDSLKAKVATAILGFKDVRTRWKPTANFWTERHSGFKLMAFAVAAEVLGGAYMDSARNAAADFFWHQDGADGAVPAGRVDGGLYHYGAQHDWDWAEDTLGASPWMSLFVVDPMLRVYGLGEDPKAANFLRRMGSFLAKSCAVTSFEGDLGKPLDYPRYAMLFDGRDGQVNEYDDPEHALDVAAGIAYGHYFAELLGQPDPTLKTMASKLLVTWRTKAGGWVRPAGPQSGLPAYRVTPWRKYNWEYRPSGGTSWALKQSGTAGGIAIRPQAPHAGAQGPAWAFTPEGPRLTLPGRDGYAYRMDALGRVTAIVPKPMGRRAP